MVLEKKKKNCKIITNEEKKGEELYFDSKPDYDIIKTLKENCYKWHNVKKCWYRKLEYIGKTRTAEESMKQIGVDKSARNNR